LLFRWIYDKFNENYINYEVSTPNFKKKSLLNVLGFPIANQTDNVVCVTTNNGYRFIQTNCQGYLVNKVQLQSFNINTSSVKIAVPSKNINLQFYSNEYYIISNNYIYLKLNFDVTKNRINTNNVINAIEQIKLQYNQNYVDALYFDVGIGEDYNCITNSNTGINVLSIDQTNIFAKILISTLPGNTDKILSNIEYNSNFSINYDASFDKITGVNVSIYDEGLKLISNTTLDKWSFTLNIHEIQDVLKETLINTKTNNVNTTGKFI
jgi:hypothetical protein